MDVEDTLNVTEVAQWLKYWINNRTVVSLSLNTVKLQLTQCQKLKS